MTPATLLPTVAENAAVGKGVVLYDGDCGFCQQSVRLLKGLDWLRLLHFQSARDTDHLPASDVPLDAQKMLDEMHLLTPDRKSVYAGFTAFRWIAWRLPLTAPLAPLLYLPGVLPLGNRAYRWVARNRFKLVPCAQNACAVPPRKSGGGQYGGIGRVLRRSLLL